MSEELGWRFKLVDETTRDAIKDTSNAWEFIDSKATWILSASAAVTTAVAGFNVIPKSISEACAAEVTAVIGMVVCSIIVAVFGALVWLPRDCWVPASSSFTSVKENLLDVSTEKAAEFHLEGMCFCLGENMDSVSGKTRYMFWMVVAFACQIAFLGLLMLAGMLT
jgi:hypothetical protein